MKNVRAIVFDLDNTLALAFEHLTPQTAHGLANLLKKMPVAIMSGATIERLEEYVLPTLPGDANLANLYLFPDTAAQCYAYENGAWKQQYNHALTKEEYTAVVSALEDGLKETGIVEGAPLWGERIVARENQVTFAGIGANAPGEEKARWDPDRTKRAKLKEYLDVRLARFPFDIRISSRTAIDITKKGVDKATGVRWFAERLGFEPAEMLFIGDDLAPGGNDAVVIPTGIKTRQVKNPAETAALIEEILRATA